MEKSLCSIFSTLGRISLTVNSSAVWPISNCCSVKSSGVKTSSVLRDSSRKLPPEILALGTAVVGAITYPLKNKLPCETTRTPYCKREWAQQRFCPRFSRVTKDFQKPQPHPCPRQ